MQFDSCWRTCPTHKSIFGTGRTLSTSHNSSRPESKHLSYVLSNLLHIKTLYAELRKKSKFQNGKTTLSFKKKMPSWRISTFLHHGKKNKRSFNLFGRVCIGFFLLYSLELQVLRLAKRKFYLLISKYSSFS